jgi:hypothetical protein
MLLAVFQMGKLRHSCGLGRLRLASVSGHRWGWVVTQDPGLLPSALGDLPRSPQVHLAPWRLSCGLACSVHAGVQGHAGWGWQGTWDLSTQGSGQLRTRCGLTCAQPRQGPRRWHLSPARLAWQGGAGPHAHPVLQVGQVGVPAQRQAVDVGDSELRGHEQEVHQLRGGPHAPVSLRGGAGRGEGRGCRVGVARAGAGLAGRPEP